MIPPLSQNFLSTKLLIYLGVIHNYCLNHELNRCRTDSALIESLGKIRVNWRFRSSQETTSQIPRTIPIIHFLNSVDLIDWSELDVECFVIVV